MSVLKFARTTLLLIIAMSVGILQKPSLPAVYLWWPTAYGADYFEPEFPAGTFDLAQEWSLSIWARPGSMVSISAVLLDSSSVSVLGMLTTEYRFFRAELVGHDPNLFVGTNRIPDDFTYNPLPPLQSFWEVGWFELLQFRISPMTPAGTYSFFVNIQYDIYYRYPILETRLDTFPYYAEFTEWEYASTENIAPGPLSVTLYVIPDASTVYLFGVGLAALPLMWLKKRRR